MTRTRTIHYCNVCDYKTNRKYDRDKHVTRKHGFSVEQNVSQTSSNIQNYHNSQYGTGQNTHYNGDYNKVVGIANGWKQQCEVKDNAICVRDNFLTANNSKLQDEITKKRILIEQNRNIIEINNQLVLERENLVSDGNDKLSAMGEDMANLIHQNKILERKYKRDNISSSYEGHGYGNKFKTNKAPTKQLGRVVLYHLQLYIF